MTQKRQSLFRQAVYEEQATTGLGEILIIVPPRARYLVMATGAATILTCVFLFFVSFSRSQVTTGSMHVAGRPVQLLIPSLGIVDKVLVKDGAIVSSGELLAVISTATLMEGGQTLQTLQLEALDKSKEALKQKKLRLESRLARANSAPPSARSSENGWANVQGIEDSLSDVEIRLAELDFQQASILSSKQAELRAPIKGRVAHIKFAPGESVVAGDRMLTLVPESTAMDAELYVPVDSMLLMRVGQPLSLSLDSSLSSDFEGFEGRVESISQDLIPSDEMKRLGLTQTSHLVRIHVESETVAKLKSRFPALYTINIKGSLPLPERRLWDWIVEPMKNNSKTLESYENQ